MGTFNIVMANMICPHCNHDISVEIELKLGDRRMESFAIGDHYVWLPRKAVQNGGRPPDGTIDGDGYTVCLQCQRDFFVHVFIQNDIVTAVKPNIDKAPYISDRTPVSQIDSGMTSPPSRSIDDLLEFLSQSEIGWPQYFQRLEAIEHLGAIGNPIAIDVLKEVVQMDTQEFDAWGLGEGFSMAYFAQAAIDKIKAMNYMNPNIDVVASFVRFFRDVPYHVAVVRAEFSRYENPTWEVDWNRARQIVRGRHLSGGEPLELVVNIGAQNLQERSDQEAYRWLEKMIMDIERHDN